MECIKFGDYEWLVLAVERDRRLLLAKDVTHVGKKYNETLTAVTWENCTLREWLNKDFYNSFSGQEQSRILPTSNVNEDNQRFGTAGGNNTNDMVFLLSLSEAVKYFGDSGQLKNEPPNPDNYRTIKDEEINDEYNTERICEYNGSPAWWWLRSPGYFGFYANYISTDGTVIVSGFCADYANNSGGVRPAMWVRL